jgi:hypothetical protein
MIFRWEVNTTGDAKHHRQLERDVNNEMADRDLTGIRPWAYFRIHWR